MQALLIALLLLAPLGALSASTEENYLATRDRYIAQFKPKDGVVFDERLRKTEDRAKDELQEQLRAIVGQTDIKGLPARGKSSLVALVQGEVGFGLLDGLVHSSADGKTSLLVTTRTLLARWLKDHQNWEPGLDMPQDANAALRSEAFYTQAIGDEWRIVRFAEIPVMQQDGPGFTYAMLSGRSQDYSLDTPDEVMVSVVKDDRAYLWRGPAAAKIGGIPACTDIWRQAEAKANEAYDAYDRSKNQDSLRDFERFQEEGYAAFLGCFAERAKGEGFFPSLGKQAQEVADRLAASAAPGDEKGSRASAQSTDALMAKFPAGARYKGKPAAVDLASHKDARTYRTRLQEAAAEGPNFAGHITVAEIGCGSSCLILALVDARDGKVYVGPTVFPALDVRYQLDSGLLIANPPEAIRETYGDNPPPAVTPQYYLWSDGRLTQTKP